MRHFGKRVLGAVLCAALLLCAVPVGNIAVSAEQNGDFEYEILEDGTASITGYMGDGGDVTIPAEIGGHRVSEIGQGAFTNCTKSVSVTVPGSVEISDYAFFGCEGLTAIYLQDGITSIGREAFAYCTALKSVTIPGSVQQVGNIYYTDCQLFRGCSRLEEVIFAEGMKSFPAVSFVDCPQLQKLSIPASMIQDNEVQGISVSLIQDNETQGRSAEFSLSEICGIPSLRTVEIAQGNPCFKTENGAVLSEDGSLLVWFPPQSGNTYEVPQGITSFAWGSDYYYDFDNNNPDTPFKYHAELSDIRFPEGVTRVDLDNCTSLKKVSLPSTVTELSLKNCKALEEIVVPARVENLDFSGCTSLRTIHVADGNLSYREIDGVLYSADGTELKYYPPAREGDYTVPDGVIQIWGMNENAHISEITLNNELRYPSELNLPSLRAFHVAEDNPQYKVIDGVLFSRDGGTLVTYPAAKQGTYRIPDGVSSIEPGAFDGCTGLTEITIPAYVTCVVET